MESGSGNGSDLEWQVPQDSLLGQSLLRWLEHAVTPEGMRDAGLITDAGLDDLREARNRAALRVADPVRLLCGE